MAETTDRVVTRVEVEGLEHYRELADAAEEGTKALRRLGGALRAFDKAAIKASESAATLKPRLDLALGGLADDVKPAREQIQGLGKDLDNLGKAKGSSGGSSGVGGALGKLKDDGKDAALGIDDVTRSFRDLDGPGEMIANKIEAISVLFSGPMGLAMGGAVVAVGALAAGFALASDALGTWFEKTGEGQRASVALTSSYEKLQIATVDYINTHLNVGDVARGAAVRMDEASKAVRDQKDAVDDSSQAWIDFKARLLDIPEPLVDTEYGLGALAEAGEKARLEAAALEDNLGHLVTGFDAAAFSAQGFVDALGSDLTGKIAALNEGLRALEFEAHREEQLRTIPGTKDVRSGPLRPGEGMDTVGRPAAKKKGGGARGGAGTDSPLGEGGIALGLGFGGSMVFDQALQAAEAFVEADRAVVALNESIAAGALFGEQSPLDHAAAASKRLAEGFREMWGDGLLADAVMKEMMDAQGAKVWADTMEQALTKVIGFMGELGLQVASTLGQFAAGGGSLKQFGDDVLDAFAGLASDLATIFVAVGSAMLFFPGLEGKGAGLIAGGLALGFASGALAEKGSGNAGSGAKGQAQGNDRAVDDIARYLRPERERNGGNITIQNFIAGTKVSEVLVPMVDEAARRGQFEHIRPDLGR